MCENERVEQNGSTYVERERVLSEIDRFVGYLDNDMVERLKIAIRKIPTVDKETDDA